MALLGRVLTKPVDTTTRRTHKVLAVRCLLCGTRHEFALPPVLRDGDCVVAACDCYNPVFIQPVRILPDA